jgi:hypothetical protein
MKVVCVDNDMNNVTSNTELEVGKIYYFIDTYDYRGSTHYTIVLDNGLIVLLDTKKFLTIEEFRNKRIEEILG